MIRADRLTKRYGPVLALRELSFEVRPGEVLGFLGPNGAGKTTALRILSGYLPPTAGAAAVDGLDLGRRSLAARRRIGYLPEAFAAPLELRVAEYLRFRAALKGLTRSARRRRVPEVASLLGLEDRLRQPVSALSKGYRQRLGLADALLARPPALLLDEPFGGLDPLQRQEFRRLLRRFAREERLAVLFSSHVLPEVEEVADRVLILHRGQTLAEGTYSELCRAAERETPLRIVTAGDPEALEAAFHEHFGAGGGCRLQDRRGAALLLRPTAPEARDELFRWLAQRREPVIEFRALQPTLEELFESVVGAAPGEEAV